MNVDAVVQTEAIIGIVLGAGAGILVLVILFAVHKIQERKNRNRD